MKVPVGVKVRVLELLDYVRAVGIFEIFLEWGFHPSIFLLILNLSTPGACASTTRPRGPLGAGGGIVLNFAIYGAMLVNNGQNTVN